MGEVEIEMERVELDLYKEAHTINASINARTSDYSANIKFNAYRNEIDYTVHMVHYKMRHPCMYSILAETL